MARQGGIHKKGAGGDIRRRHTHTVTYGQWARVMTYAQATQGGMCARDTWGGIRTSDRVAGAQQGAHVVTCPQATQGGRRGGDPCDDMRIGHTGWHSHAGHMG